MNIANAITSVSVAIAALSFVSGVAAWKREFIGKRQIELAESVLAMFYEVEDAIREIRNPISYGCEGKTRKRAENEVQAESQLLDQAYVVFERYQKRKKLFAELRSIKYRFMAAFGIQAGEPFTELDRILGKIFSSARMLGTHYWQRQGRVTMSEEAFQKHLDEMYKHEAVFWWTGDEEDRIDSRMRNVINQVEKVTKITVEKSSVMSVRLPNPLKKR